MNKKLLLFILIINGFYCAKIDLIHSQMTNCKDEPLIQRMRLAGDLDNVQQAKCLKLTLKLTDTDATVMYTLHILSMNP